MIYFTPYDQAYAVYIKAWSGCFILCRKLYPNDKFEMMIDYDSDTENSQ